MCCRIGEFLGYSPDDLLGKSVFDYHYALDSEILDRGFKNCKYIMILFFKILDIQPW